MIQSDLYSNIKRTNGNDLFVTQMSQMAAYESKTDYGFDLGDSLSQQATARLAYL